MEMVAGKLGGLSEVQFNWKPQNGYWSAGQCLQHVNMLGRYWVKHLEAVVQESGPKGNDYRPTRIGRRLIARMNTDRLLKRPPRTRSRFQPHFSVYSVGCLSEFRETQKRLETLAGLLQDKDPGRHAIGWYQLPMVRLPLGDTLHLAAAHTMAFTGCAEAVAGLPEFPAS